MDVAVRTVNLRKTYLSRGSRRVAVSGLTMSVPHGGVHGFLGPNGSGKTTTIRMLLGLDPCRLRHGRGLRRGGAGVDSPRSSTGSAPSSSRRSSSRPSRPGRTSCCSPAPSAARAPASTRCSRRRTSRDRGRDRYAGFSLGMKQRLAIAATLLKDPDLLIFDEPTNGLDPAGIREVRDTMRSLGAQGKTVLVSSHILAEVEQVADTVSIIGHGVAARRGPRAATSSAGPASRRCASAWPPRTGRSRCCRPTASA